MKFNKILGTLVLASVCGFSQTQKYTMNDAVLGLRSNLAIKNIREFSFSNDGKSYIQSVKNTYLISDFATNKSDTLVSLYRINQNLAADKKLKALSSVKFINNSKAYFSQKGTYFWLENSGNSWKTTEFASVPEDAENVQFLADNQTIVYTVKKQSFRKYQRKVHHNHQ